MVINEERLRRLTNINSLVGEDNRLFIESWNLWKTSDCFCWWCKSRVSVFFYITFFIPYLYLLLSATSIYCATLAEMRYIPIIESWFLTKVLSFTNLALFWFSVVMHSFFIYWICMTNIFLAASFTAAPRIYIFDYFCVPLDWKTTIWVSVKAPCNLADTTVWRDLLFISSALTPKHNWMEAAPS